MTKQRAAKGYLVQQVATPNISAKEREKWLAEQIANFVSPSKANRTYYGVILKALWPEGSGLPGPILSQNDLREAIDTYRESENKPKYKDVFRRVRELQGEEGFTCIVKEGVCYQLQNRTMSQKRDPRWQPNKAQWGAIKSETGHKCAVCGSTEPQAKLSPDHRVPRAKGGANAELANIQPLCEQCNNQKSSMCSGCSQNCYTCPWAFPEHYKIIQVNDNNRELIRRQGEKSNKHQSDIVNEILTGYFNSNS
nr:HNH endonuclease signature motif containing protein [uncultured Holophaga sp.]